MLFLHTPHANCTLRELKDVITYIVSGHVVQRVSRQQRGVRNTPGVHMVNTVSALQIPFQPHDQEIEHAAADVVSSMSCMFALHARQESYH